MLMQQTDESLTLALGDNKCEEHVATVGHQRFHAVDRAQLFSQFRSESERNNSVTTKKLTTTLAVMLPDVFANVGVHQWSDVEDSTQQKSSSEVVDGVRLHSAKCHRQQMRSGGVATQVDSARSSFHCHLVKILERGDNLIHLQFRSAYA